ncbi:MAG: undecaprenyl-phosphate glucose phosphotransferase [Bacteroidetes bacterium]|nr:undecaprenyl-phosphate glucose phosphotransferase [Bacteroidota bacterium]
MRRELTKIGIFKFTTDFIVIITVFYLSLILSNKGFQRSDGLLLIMLSLGWYFSTKANNFYGEFRTEKFVGEMLILVQNVALQVIIAGQVFFSLNQMSYSRTFVMYYAILLSITLFIKSYITKKALLIYRERGGNTRMIAFVGHNSLTENLIELIVNNPHFGMKISGLIAIKSIELPGIKYLGDIDHFILTNASKIDEIIVTSNKISKDKIKILINYCDQKAIRLKFVPNFDNFYYSRFQFQLFGNYPLITLRAEPLQQPTWVFIKRMFDIVFALLVFVLIYSWLIPIMAIIIKLESPGPVFFLQDRWGKNGEKFKCFKFRSMRTEQTAGEFQQAQKSDNRITKVGAFIRKTSIDELPQFINVLLGDMSVVGPRPHAHEHNLLTKDTVDKYMMRHWVKPGVTGWAQVNGFRGETKTVEQMQLRVDYDIWYIEHWSLWLDLKIIFMTVYNLIKGEEMAY